MIVVVVVAHQSRVERADRLASAVGAEHLIVDTADRGPAWGHLQALGLASRYASTGHLVVIEDDALPSPGFRAGVAHWCGRFPHDLISYYLGQVRPENHQNRIASALAHADRRRLDHIHLSGLIHGVCYSIPCAGVPHIMESVRERSAAIDQRIGSAWFRIMRRQIVYTVPSLVDHDDTLPSLVTARAGRVAWRPPEATVELG